MTSYSTYGTSQRHLGLIDGSTALSTEEGKAEEQMYAISHALASGAARALLDSTHDAADHEADVNATEWHSADEGWEIDAIHDGDRSEFLSLVEQFTRANLPDILTLVQRIAWSKRWAGEMWHGDDGMAFYRVGMLLGYEGAGVGIGFSDYSEGDENYNEGLSARLRTWVEANVGYVWEQSWIDSNEEPCRLHLSI